MMERLKSGICGNKVRMWCFVAVVVVLVAAGVMVARQANSSEVDRSAAWKAEVAAMDHTVMSDTIALATPMPDASIVREMRISRASNWLLFENCGGSPDPTPDSTEGRMDQSRYAYLPLIADRGFSESLEKKAPDHYDEECVKRLAKQMPDLALVRGEWHERSEKALHSGPVLRKSTRAAQCLSDRMGYDLPGDKVGAEFIGKVDGALIRSEEDEFDATHRKHVDAFVDCTGEYYDAIRAELEPQRAEFVEEHHELLSDYAAAMTELGYQP